jgi:Tfp pilus assembly protein PilX
MSSTSTITITTQTQQRGVVLVVSLLILLVLTLLGISSLDSSVMEEKMASNAQTASSTFQAADSAIRQTFYAESLDPARAVAHAESGTTETYGDISASTVMSVPVPVTTDKTPPTRGNNSAGQGLGTRRIEIIGTANVGDINSRHVQGYDVFPMPGS